MKPRHWKACRLQKKHFENISIDLIYGIPGLTDEKWKENLKIALELEIPHISSYALTIEADTALEKFIEKGKLQPVEDEQYRRQFDILVQTLTQAGFEHYEFSNYGKTGFHSRNNMAYWLGKPYLGVGPSAHSFDGKQRKWNISNNSIYINSLEMEKIPQETEELSINDRYNEYVMTRLRTKFGVNVLELEQDFGKKYRDYFERNAENFLQQELMLRSDLVYLITKKREIPERRDRR